MKRFINAKIDIVKDMKGRILEISDQLRSNKISDSKAQTLLLDLFLVSKSPKCKKCNDELRFLNVFGELTACKDCYEGGEGI